MDTKANVSTVASSATPAPKEASIKTPDNRLRETDNIAVWTVIGLQGCPWTSKAVELLKSRKETYKLVFLNTDWQRKLVVEYNCRRSPAIFRGVQYIGSYGELENYYKCWFFSDSETI